MRRIVTCLSLAILACVASAVASDAAPSPTPVPAYEILPPPSPEATSQLATPGPIDPVAERYLAQARAAWRARTDVPFVHYGALVRYSHNNHVFDNWWDAYFRTSDGSLALERLVDTAEEKRRLSGVPFSIFGVKIFDTNRDAEPIRLDEPRITPTTTFGLVPAFAPVSQGGAQPEPTGSTLPQIALVATSGRAYDVRYVGRSQIGTVSALHLTFTPLHDPKNDRLRELWLDPTTFRTMQMRVQGILNGKPYDGVSWDAHYVELDGRNYLQQIVAEEPLHFGTGTTIPQMEFDFFDYHFPDTVPDHTFDSRIF